MSFSSFKLHPSLLRGLADLGFDQPTPIQQKAISPALEGRDILACAMTGSGKTAAFLLPIMNRLLSQKRGTTRALVLAPTRELAAQIVEHFQALAKHTPLRAAAVYGGVGMEPQQRAFRQGVDMIVACPGRLLDHFQHAYARLEGLEVLVLDEADRMLDMGFLPDIRRILKQLPPRQQTMLFSATLPQPIVALSRDLLQNPVSLDVERRSEPATGVTQAIFTVRQELKPALLLRLLAGNDIEQVLVFTRTKHRADRLAKTLGRQGVVSDRIHGNRSQSQRTKALDSFKNGTTRVLVATDIAARGIDVEALSHVINFDVPHVPEDYIHRVGRTARAGATGEAFTFVSPQELNDLRAIERAVGKRLPRREVEGLEIDAAPEALEIPLADRIAAIRARKAEERARARAKAERKAQQLSTQGQTRGQRKPAAQGQPQGPRKPGAQHQAPGRRKPAVQGQNQELRKPALQGQGHRLDAQLHDSQAAPGGRGRSGESRPAGSLSKGRRRQPRNVGRAQSR